MPIPLESMIDAETALAIEPEELAGVLLTYLNSLPERDQYLNRHNLFHNPHQTFAGFGAAREAVANAFLEAWVWLEREGLIIPRVGAGHEWISISRRGRTMQKRADVEAYRRASLLPRRLLHGAIVDTVTASFLRGDYDTAVFQAFKAVEVAVRRAGGLKNEDIGMPLMWKAFHKVTGRLRDKKAPEGEREALAHLFAGAIGAFKNPQSHRKVSISDPVEAVEILMIASHLLRVIDSRTPKPRKVTETVMRRYRA